MHIKGNCSNGFRFGKIYDISPFINDNYNEKDNIYVIQRIWTPKCGFGFTINNVKTPQDDESIQILKNYFKNCDSYQNKTINHFIFDRFTEISIKLAINLIKANEGKYSL